MQYLIYVYLITYLINVLAPGMWMSNEFICIIIALIEAFCRKTMFNSKKKIGEIFHL
jgi:hypothetical protein